MTGIEGSAMTLDRDRLLAELAGQPSGLDWCVRHTKAVDHVIAGILAEAERSFPDFPSLSIVATGGYGRSELAPHSDVDLTLVPGDEAHPAIDPVVKWLFKAIQTSLGDIGLKVGYAFRLVSDIPGVDAKTRTGLLDARLVAGDPQPLQAIKHELFRSFPTAEFLISKIDEREAALRRHHDTPLVTEPQLKEGAGGLRCFHCANWIRVAMGERPLTPTEELDVVQRARNLLHFTSGRQVDLLSHVRLAEVAKAAGQEPLAFASEVVEAMSGLHAEYLRARAKVHESRFPLASHVTAISGEARVSSDASASDAALGIAHATRLDLRVSDVPSATRPYVKASDALVAISQGEATIRNMAKCGVLDSLLPELAACRTLMPKDSSHAYTVYEHTLRAIRMVDSAEDNSWIGGLLREVRDRGLLNLAILLHDAGKLSPGRPHSESGYEIVHAVSDRWALQDTARDLVSWLVLEHLTLAHFLRMRDVARPETAQELAAKVGTVDRLRLLTILTWADVNAVGPDVWTPGQQANLQELYTRTSAVLQESTAESDPASVRRRLGKRLKHENIDESEVAAFLDSLPAHYMMSASLETVREHLLAAQKARDGEPTVMLKHDRDSGSTEITVCCPDAPGLLNKILGIIYAHDLSVLGLRASTTTGDQPVLLDTFDVSFGSRSLPSGTASVLQADLVKLTLGNLDVDELLRARGKDPQRSQEILTHEFVPGQPGIIEIQAPRGRGMAYRVSRIIAEQGWNVHAARVGQWAGRGAAAFYVTGPNDAPLTAQQVARAFRKR